MPDGNLAQEKVVDPVACGVKGRCPQCGQGRLFGGYLKVVGACEVCGLSFRGHDTGDGPVVPALMILGGIIVGLALWVEFTHAWPVWLHFLVWLPLGLIGTLLILPPLKGMAIGLQYKFRSTDQDELPGGVS